LNKKLHFKDLTNKLRVLARSTAEVKAMLVNGLMKDKNIVAVTGAGISDLKAMKNADVSMSLGNRMQSEVTKDHSDIVLLDDNIQSILSALMWGRAIYGNVRKFL
jgi:P-type E1-E2 ATPase